MSRTVRLPEQYWEIIDAEARRCKRSGEKQLEALLSRVFGLGNVDIEIDENGVLASLKRSKRAASRARSKKSSTNPKKTR